MVLLLMLWGLGSGFLASEEVVEASPDELEGEREVSIRESLSEIHMMEAPHDGKGWELWADKSFRYEGQEGFHLQGIRAVFPSREKEGIFLTVTGESGRVDVDTMDMRVHGNVVIQSTNGYLFKTKSVNYFSRNRQLESRDPIQAFFPRDKKGRTVTVRGSEMIAYSDQSRMEVIGEVVAQKLLSPGKKLKIESDKMELSGKSMLAKFFGNVVMNMDKWKVAGSQAEFEYEKGVISSIIVKGRVRLHGIDRWAVAEQLEAHLKTDQLILRGSPRVVQSGDEVRGEEIIFYNDSQSIEIRKARVKMDKSDKK